MSSIMRPDISTGAVISIDADFIRVKCDENGEIVLLPLCAEHAYLLPPIEIGNRYRFNVIDDLKTGNAVAGSIYPLEAGRL